MLILVSRLANGESTWSRIWGNSQSSHGTSITMITNIKFHVKINDEKEQSILALRNFLNNGSSEVVKKCASFAVVRWSGSKAVFCCYYKGHINVTGVKSAHEIIEALEQLTKIGIKRTHLSPIVVDNLSSKPSPSHISTKLRASKHRINLYNLVNIIHALHLPEVLSVKYNRQKFPGLFIRTVYGTILWFNSNAVSCVGSKSASVVVKLHNLIKIICHEVLRGHRYNL